MSTWRFFGFVVALGLLVHLVGGSSAEVVWRDVAHTLALILFALAVVLFYIAFRLQFTTHKVVYERNRKATRLARKYNKGAPLTEAEQGEIERWLAAGVLEHRGLVFTTKKPHKVVRPLQLTNDALDQIWK